MAEAEDLKSSQCGFDPHSGHQFVSVNFDGNLLGKESIVRRIVK